MEFVGYKENTNFAFVQQVVLNVFRYRGYCFDFVFEDILGI